MPRTVSREMALSRAEFLRLLPTVSPAALRAAFPDDGTPASPAGQDGPGYSLVGPTIVVGGGERRVEILLTEEGERRLGSLRLPAARVRLDFFGFTEQEMTRFMACFDNRYRRGGG